MKVFDAEIVESLTEFQLNLSVSRSIVEVNRFTKPVSPIFGSSPAEFLAMDVEGWRSNLMPDSRQRIISKIAESLMRHLPVSGEAGLQELRRIAERFEEKIYNAATSQSDYLRKISLKMITMESTSQTSLGFRQQELERAAEKIEQDMCAEAISQPDYMRKISILENAFDEFKSRNALGPNCTDVCEGPLEPDSAHGI